MSATKSALIIANYRYDHPDLRQLTAPAQDAESLARVLGDPAVGGFQVVTLINEPNHKLNQEIEKFCVNRKRNDLLLIYFSGHGIKDADGRLYFASVNTQLVQHEVLTSTAVPAQFVNEVMSRSLSRRQILLLDCCYSGAFKQGMLAKGDKRVGAAEQLEGQGRIVLTASDALQYSFEGEHVEGEGVRSVFTRTLVQGLETGDADTDRDGFFSLDEVYNYVHDRVLAARPEQKPTKMGYVEGRIFIGTNPRPRASKLPPELQESLEDPRPWVRQGAVHELERLLASNHKGMALAAEAALGSLAAADDSLQVRQAAAKCLAARTAPPLSVNDILPAPAAAPAGPPQEPESSREQQAPKPEPPKRRDAAKRGRLAGEGARQEQPERERVEAERQARESREKAEAERLAGEKAEQERLAREQTEKRRAHGPAEVEQAALQQTKPDTDAWVKHVQRGDALRKKGNTKAAIDEYHEAIRLDPQNDAPRLKLADALEGVGKLDEAIAECNQALRLKPDSAEAHYRLGLLRYEKYYVEESRRDLKSAIAEYGEALRLNPKHARAHHDLAGALEHSRTASELEPQNAGFRADYRRLAKAKAKSTAAQAVAKRSAPSPAERPPASTMDPVSGEELLALRGHRGEVWSVAWSPDGARLATAGGDKTVKVWNAETGRELMTLQGSREGVRTVDWNSDPVTNWVAAASTDGRLRIWDTNTGEEELDDIVGGEGWLMAFRPMAGEEKPEPEAKGWLRALISTPGGKWKNHSRQRWLAHNVDAGDAWDESKLGGVNIRYVDTGETLPILHHPDVVRSIAWNPDGMRLATGTIGGTVRIWKVEAGKEAVTLASHTASVTSLSWNPDGSRLATASEDGTVKVWDAGYGTKLLTITPAAPPSPVWSVAWRPHGNQLATGSENKTARTWDAETGTELLTLTGHRGAIRSVSWSPDGNRLATGSEDKTAKVWDFGLEP
jgi:WD40 repeat protein/tetratricopeptide (TPR) repeat protein